MRRTIKSPDDTDVVVGQRIRSRRLLLGISQTKLGNKLGITFQQIQKYEKGTKYRFRFSLTALLARGHPLST